MSMSSKINLQTSFGNMTLALDISQVLVTGLPFIVQCIPLYLSRFYDFQHVLFSPVAHKLCYNPVIPFLSFNNFVV